MVAMPVAVHAAAQFAAFEVLVAHQEPEALADDLVVNIVLGRLVRLAGAEVRKQPRAVPAVSLAAPLSLNMPSSIQRPSGDWLRASHCRPRATAPSLAPVPPRPRQPFDRRAAAARIQPFPVRISAQHIPAPARFPHAVGPGAWLTSIHPALP